MEGCGCVRKDIWIKRFGELQEQRVKMIGNWIR